MAKLRAVFNDVLEKWKAAAGRLKRETYVLYLAYKHPAVPWYAKVFAGLVVAYAFSPIDLIPDFIPILGYLDDLILVPLGIAAAIKMIPPEVMAECRHQAQEEMIVVRQTNWAAAAVIVLVWLGLAALGLRWAIRLLK